jgi:hypothetical protein
MPFPMPFLRRAAVLAVAMFVLIGAAGVAATAQQSTDWDTVILSDPRITLVPDCPRFVESLGPCIEVADDGATPSSVPASGDRPPMIVGYAATAPGDVGYGDLDGDGAGEAVIRIESGGTAGTIGFLLFRDGPAGPSLITARSGYKVFPRIEQGRLLLTQPYYFGFEGNCCPTAAVTEVYILDGDDLRLLTIPGESPGWSVFGPNGEYPATFAEVTVAGFYNALDHGACDDAYAFLSPAFQAAHPFPAWREGFATTRRIMAETFGTREIVDLDGRMTYEVIVSLAVEDELASSERIGRRYAGVWYLVEGPGSGLPLRLNDARIGEVP